MDNFFKIEELQALVVGLITSSVVVGLWIAVVAMYRHQIANFFRRMFKA